MARAPAPSRGKAAQDALLDLGGALLLTREGADDDQGASERRHDPLEHPQLPLRRGHILRGGGARLRAGLDRHVALRGDLTPSSRLYPVAARAATLSEVLTRDIVATPCCTFNRSTLPPSWTPLPTR